MSAALPWVVIDFETTGIHPSAHHRAVEVALVRGRAGEIEDEWTTLLNPQRDIGAGDIHGLFGRDLQAAPTFADVAGAVIERLEGRAVAAHNVRFDLAFLEAELERCAVALPPVARLCTLELARSLGLSSGRLADCCAELGIEHDGAHSALADARACARLLIACLSRTTVTVSLPDQGTWPQRPCTREPVTRTTPGAPRQSFLADLVRSRPPMATAPDCDTAAYVELLDRVLEDRHVTEQEAQELKAAADLLGLSAPQVDAAHHGYLSTLYRHALADAILTDRERRDLEYVGELLGIPFAAFAGEAAVVDGNHGSPNRASAGSATTDLAGQSVCFTGSLLCTLDGQPITRDLAHQLAQDAGLTVHPRVTRKLDVLVVADPDSLSSKAQKARDYGTRIVAETAFWRMIGVRVS